MDWDDSWPVWDVATRVECAEHFPTRRAALLAHRTQVDPDGPELSCPVELERRVWPTEDYHLARSHVPTVSARGRPVRRDQPGPGVSGWALTAPPVRAFPVGGQGETHPDGWNTGKPCRRHHGM
ncbi:hypothetical protein LX15_002886 [Streptoalloteichus tenebrarius]|uniref:Uncharacterized protein n=1 Tax=Streptoalloteichus tenebrarius (strain ATCC 17920 / DSM 40477 / JCM 4838 / CBS 697.72 / NBRC 16177 / NCIMB 11028 / NRRL B-12390 / A12253. 1 / ISP 5477) TaxID=1933 RepID=A0ABT1HUJ1_STRSD|nr:hypothetical protein [Streptoalloteichus tenebrarius]BFF04335.1 hypothetical protein GCM10020241_60100 [Streptoalloteichus tenebrarius]